MVRAAPKVTGLSPKEGPPGTRIIIRGENLGNTANDLLSCVIGGVECVFQAEWQSSSKILCRSGHNQGAGDVIITTKSGGRGSCTVQFRGYMDAVGPTKESAVWVDDSRFGDGAGRNQSQLPAVLAEGQDPLALSDEPSKCNFSEEQLLEMFQDGSGNITQENFVPAWYLLENHSGATLEDLKHGLKHMQTQNRHQVDGPVAYLKGHLGSYFECIDTLDNLEVRFGEDSSVFIENVDSLIEKISSARDLSNHTYQAVFERRQKMDFYRHCIATVNRFHYVFDLLSSIHKNIKNRHFHSVVVDYKKLQQLLGKSSVKVLQDIFREVEKKVNGLRQTLKDELKQMPGTVETQIQICRNLSELEDDGDSGWECINNVHAYTLDKMFEIYSFHFTDVAGAVGDVKRAFQNRTYQRIEFHFQVTSPSDLDFDVTGVPNNSSSSAGGVGGVVDEPSSAPRDRHETITSSASICQLIRALSDFTVKSVRQLVRLGEAYFQAEMKDLGGFGAAGRDPAALVDQGKYVRQRGMVVETVHLYVVILQCALRSKETLIKAEDFYDAITAIQQVRKTVMGQTECGDLLRTLIMEIKKALVFAILDRGITEMESVSTNASDRADKTLRLASKMPEIFTTVAVKTFSMTKQFILDDTVHNANILAEASTMDVLIDKWTRLLNMPVETLHEFGASSTGIVVFLSLMAVHTLVVKVLPRLFRMLDNVLHGALQSIQSVTMERYNDLSIDLVKSFVEMKAEPVMGVIEKQMNDYGVDWKNSPEPRGVNAYVTRIALDLNAVMEELCVFASEYGMNDEIMKGIVTKVCEELNRLFFVAPGFNANGVLQGHIDLATVRLVIGPYLSKSAASMLNEISQLLQDQNAVFKKETITKLINEYTKSHHMLYLGK